MKKHHVATIAIVPSCFFLATAYATPITKRRTAVNVDWCSAGISGVGGGSGNINLDCVNGTVKKAFLYWHGINNSSPSAVYDNATVNINGNPVTGISLGDATTNCWGPGSSRAFEADVTGFVYGDGSYEITNLSSLSGYNANGASLVVIFDDGNDENNRDLVFFSGNDSNYSGGFPGEDEGWHASLPGIDYRGGSVAAQLHLADGQYAGDSDLKFSTANGSYTINDNEALYDGNSLPTAGTSRSGSYGQLWDSHTIDITPAFAGTPGLVTLNIDGQEAGSDCLGLSLMLLDLEPFSAPNAIGLEPKDGLSCTGENHAVTATIKNNDGIPQPRIDVAFEITSGPNAGKSATIATNADGKAVWQYADTALLAGIDDIAACFAAEDAERKCASSTKEWKVCNESPDCSNAKPTMNCIWPPDHNFVDIGIIGVKDPDGDAVTIQVTGVTSDEATATVRGAGGIYHAPDAKIDVDAAHTVALRAERSGKGDGRVYGVSFTADDGNGGRCTGNVQVSVPHSMSKKTCSATDSGQNIDALQ